MIPEAARSREEAQSLPVRVEPYDNAQDRLRSRSDRSRSDRERPFDFGLRPTLRANGSCSGKGNWQGFAGADFRRRRLTPV